MSLGGQPARRPTEGRKPAKAFAALLFKLPGPVSSSARRGWRDLPCGLRNLNEITRASSGLVDGGFPVGVA